MNSALPPLENRVGCIGAAMEVFRRLLPADSPLQDVLMSTDRQTAILRRLVDDLLDRYDIEIGGGLGDYAGKVWRIGCMGHTARPRNVSLLLGVLDELLDR